MRCLILVNVDYAMSNYIYVTKNVTFFNSTSSNVPISPHVTTCVTQFAQRDTTPAVDTLTSKYLKTGTRYI